MSLPIGLRARLRAAGLDALGWVMCQPKGRLNATLVPGDPVRAGPRVCRSALIKSAPR